MVRLPQMIDDFISEAMECPVCTQIFEQPRQLRCGHSLCSHCVERLVELSQASHSHDIGGNAISRGLGGTTPHTYHLTISCPICRADTSVPSRGLPLNYALGELISRFHMAQEMKRSCSVCERSISYEAQMFCVTCSQGATTPARILCVMCALNDHSKHGHEVQQMEPSLETARQDAIQQIEDAKTTAQVWVAECENANANFQNTLERYAKSVKDQLNRFDSLVNGLQQLDYICPTNVSEQGVARAERLGRSVRESCMAYASWLQDMTQQVDSLIDNNELTFNLAEAGVNPSTSMDGCGNLQNLTINGNREDGPSNGGFPPFTRNTPPQRASEMIKQRRQAAIAKRRAGSRHAADQQNRLGSTLSSAQSRSTNAFASTNSNREGDVTRTSNPHNSTDAAAAAE